MPSLAIKSLYKAAPEEGEQNIHTAMHACKCKSGRLRCGIRFELEDLLHVLCLHALNFTDGAVNLCLRRRKKRPLGLVLRVGNGGLDADSNLAALGSLGLRGGRLNGKGP